jgi:hypothetical protein
MYECLYGCFSFFISGEMAPFECPLRSREEVEVAGHQVGTVGGVIPALPTEGGNMVDRCCCCVGSCIVMQKDDSCYEKARSLPSNGIVRNCSTHPFTMLAGHAPFHCPVFNTAPPAWWRSYVPQQMRKAACGHRTQWHPTSSTQSLEIKWGNLFSDYPTYFRWNWWSILISVISILPIKLNGVGLVRILFHWASSGWKGIRLLW